MEFCSNEHFSGLRNRWFSCSFYSILLMSLWCLGRCCSFVSFSSCFVCIAISSIYTVNQPSATLFANIVFIIVWKVAGELVSLKNITIGLNNP